jgi:hypothetical protein
MDCKDTHDNGLVAVLLVVVVNTLYGLDTRILLGRVILLVRSLVPTRQPTINDRDNQSRILPTKGEINVTPASAQATACTKLNKSVKLQ